jgi:acyl-coenzyme A synthetase/AMP-(fatty) acid ligase
VDLKTRAVLGPDQIGLLEVKTARSTAAGADGWTQTNDLGRIDADGFLYVDGRADDVISRGGFKVSLEEIDAALLSHPDVQFVASIDLPDARLGAVPATAVILYPDSSAGPDVLRAYLRERLAAYKIPVLIALVEELPRTPSMKIRKADLRALLAESQARAQMSEA